MKKIEVLSCIAAAGLILNACGERENSVPVPIPTPSWKFEAKDSINDILRKYYPEIAGLPVLQSGEFTTTRSTRWANLTNLKFNANTARGVYVFLEQPRDIPTRIDYRDSNGVIEEITLALVNPKDRLLVILPESAPKPNWPVIPGQNPNVFDATGITINNSNRGDFPAISLIRVPDKVPSSFDPISSSIEVYINSVFNLEACQSSIRALTQSSPEKEATAQEVVCSSLGHALTFRQMGVGYRDYEQFTARLRFRIIQGYPSYPAIVFSNKAYDALPNKRVIEKN